MPQYAVVFLSITARFRAATPEIFFCSAADADDAQALCEQANPGAKLLHVAEGYDRHERDEVLHEFFRQTVEVGSPVYWCGPENDPRSGICMYHGSDTVEEAVRLESFAEWFEAPVSELAILPGRPEDSLDRLQALVGDCLGLAQTAVTAATIEADGPGSIVSQLLGALSEAEQCLSEVGLADIDPGIAPRPLSVSRAA